MKKVVFFVASFLIVAACFVVAVVEYNNHKTTVAAKQTSLVQQAENNLKLHDAVNAANVANLNKQLATANTQFKTDQQQLCQFILAHTVKGVTVPSECTASPQ